MVRRFYSTPRPTQKITHMTERGAESRLYTLMTHGAEASLPIIATVMKTQLAQSGVEVTVEVRDN
jgi:hypothetical protein